MRAIILSGLVLLSTGFAALADQDYDKCIIASDSSNAAWSNCGSDWIKREDDRLNAAWKAAYGRAQGSIKTAMLAEQRKWNDYKEVSCQLYGEGFGREGQVLAFPDCRAKVIAQRTRELQAYEKALTPK